MMAPLSPVQATPGKSRVFHLRLANRNSEFLKPSSSTLRDFKDAPLARNEISTSLEHSHNFDRELSRKMRITGARKGQTFAAPARLPRARTGRRFAMRRNRE